MILRVVAGSKNFHRFSQVVAGFSKVFRDSLGFLLIFAVG